MRLIREPCKRFDETAATVRGYFLDWQMDAAVGLPVRGGAGGLAVLSDDALEVLDDCAAKSGLGPTV